MTRGAKKITRRRERGVMVRAIVPLEIEEKLRELAARESRTLSGMIARILVKVVDKES